MNVATVFGDVLDIAMASEDKCPCVTLSHVTENECYSETVTEMIALLEGVVTNSRPEDVSRNVAHVLTVIIATGYALGAGDAYDITLQSEVCVPENLSTLDFVEGRPGDRGTRNE